jgi:hypothetical protein
VSSSRAAEQSNPRRLMRLSPRRRTTTNYSRSARWHRSKSGPLMSARSQKPHTLVGGVCPFLPGAVMVPESIRWSNYPTLLGTTGGRSRPGRVRASSRIHRQRRRHKSGIAALRRGKAGPNRNQSTGVRRYRAPVEASHIGQLSLKGFSRPIDAYEVVSRASGSSR